MQRGHRWLGAGLPWPLRESHLGRSGSTHSRRHGSGIDFSETRVYQSGDELRHFNWRAMARTGQPQVRIFQQDLAPVSCFLIDRRAPMRFGTRRRLKVTQAARLAIFLATWEARRGAELAGLMLEQKALWQSPVSGEKGIYQLAQRATQPCPPIDQDADQSVVDFKQSLAQLVAQLSPGSHLYLLSDFNDLKKSMLPQLFQLGKQHQVWAIGIYDPAEQQLPQAGSLQLVWRQGSGSTVVNSENTAIRQQQRHRFNRRQQEIKTLFDQAGIYYSSVFCDVDEIEDLLQGSHQ